MKKFLVFGLGISGNQAVKFLLDHNCQVLAGDNDKSSTDNLKQKFSQSSNLQIFENISQIDWNNIDYLVLAAGISLKYPKPHPIVLEAQKHNCPIICDVEILYLFNSKANFIGISGTNGKSTTTALTGHIFSKSGRKSSFGGNIGIAALSLPELKEEETYIIELSSYQLDLMYKTHLNISCLLNITPDHLDRHKNMTGYIAAKKRIFQNQNQGDFAVIGVDNKNTKEIYENLQKDKNFKAKLIPISTKEIVKDGVSMINNTIYNNINNKNSKIDLGERGFLKGEHNAQNIAASFANCFLSGIDEKTIIGQIKSFRDLKHRMEFVDKVNNINFINDSKATNAQSTQNALQTYDNIYLILGGEPKEGGISSLEPYFSKIKCAFLIGKSQEEFAKTLKNKLLHFKCHDLKTAFNMAYKKALDDEFEYGLQKNIILSPACASFDQWKNFEERGNFFCQLVKNINKN
jgi:UDP-N-acetylmuramoylalanine--D-glutamate ligase